RSDPQRPEYLNGLGALLYRAGRYDEALRRLQEAAGVPQHAFWNVDGRGAGGRVYNALFQAMAYARLGHTAETRGSLGQAVQWFEEFQRQSEPAGGDAPAVPLPWWQKLEFQLLRREAEALMDGA